MWQKLVQENHQFDDGRSKLREAERRDKEAEAAGKEAGRTLSPAVDTLFLGASGNGVGKTDG